MPYPMAACRPKGGGVYPVVSDAFSRADSALALGSAESGQAWTAQTGTWGISSGQAYCPSAAGWYSWATLDSGLAAYRLSCLVTVPLASGEAGLILRWVDADNHVVLRVYCNGSAFVLIVSKRVAGTWSDVGNTGVTWAAGDVLSAVVNGTNIKAYQNGTQLLNLTVEQFTDNTVQGIQKGSGAVANAWDNYEVYSL